MSNGLPLARVHGVPWWRRALSWIRAPGLLLEQMAQVEGEMIELEEELDDIRDEIDLIRSAIGAPPA